MYKHRRGREALKGYLALLCMLALASATVEESENKILLLLLILLHQNNRSIEAFVYEYDENTDKNSTISSCFFSTFSPLFSDDSVIF